MSFLSTLGKLGMIAGPIIGAPFTGGASLLGLSAGSAAALGAGISGVGQVLGAGAANSKAGRTNDALTNTTLNSRNNADALAAAKFNMDAPSARFGQVVKGDLANNVQDVGETGSGRDLQFTGGVRPSALGPASHQAASEMQRQALMKLMSGGDQLTPAQTTMERPDLMEKIGGVAGTVGGILGALQQPKIATMGNVYRKNADEPNDENGWG